MLVKEDPNLEMMMLSAQTTHSSATGRLNAPSLEETPAISNRAPAVPKSVSISFSAIEIDGSNFNFDPREVTIERLAIALRLAKMHGKQELMIENIAPAVHSPDKEASRVPLLKKEIESFLEVACSKSNGEMPECRLDLHNGSFGLRCYLGRMKPTDFIFAEDHLSDSR